MVKIASINPTSRARVTVLGLSTTSPVENSVRKEVLAREPKIVQIFYVGGAGDKRGYPLTVPGEYFGPFNNIDAVNIRFTRDLGELGLKQSQKPTYLGYYEVYGDDRIKANVISKIPKKDSPIIIIGHSLGGWNGAHLSNWLNTAGYSVELLITLDPVGEGFMVTALSDIYPRSAHVAAKRWVNVRAIPKERDPSDSIADLGGQWDIKAGPTLSGIANTNHGDAVKMFYTPLNGGESARDVAVRTIREVAK